MIPEKIDRYKIMKQLGGGGMGIVYKAHDPEGRFVALKATRSIDLQAQERFIQEFKVALPHHHAIVPIYDRVYDKGHLYLVMPWMPGGTLAERIRKGSSSLLEIHKILERITSALDALHLRGYIHRDVKPHNILFDNEGYAYLSDFGIVKPIDKQGEESLTQTGGVVGTPGYMSPEQINSGQLQPTSDIYALGIVLVEMLTGQKLYEGSNKNEIYAKQLNEPLPNILELRPDLTPRFQLIIEKALAPEPTNRYQSAPELADSFFGALLETGKDTHLVSETETWFTESSVPLLHPLLDYTNPVSSLQFFGRQRLINDILHLIQGRQSITISGLPYMGKSSLLLRLREQLSENETGRFVTQYIDLNQVADNYEPQMFWQEVTTPLLALTDDNILFEYLTQAQNGAFQTQFLYRIFRHLRNINKGLILLLDNFENLLNYQWTIQSPFFATLRKLFTPGGLVIIVTSRLSRREMLKRARAMLDLGSRLLNPMNSKKLGPFPPETAKAWLASLNISPDEADGVTIRQRAGHHPYLLQVVTASFIATESDMKTTIEGLTTAYFEELWEVLEQDAQSILLILTLIELEVTDTYRLSNDSSRNQQIFNRVLRGLAASGLIRTLRPNSKIDKGRAGLVLGSKEWVIDAQLLTKWVQEYVLIGYNDSSLAYRRWFNNEFHDWIDKTEWRTVIMKLRHNSPISK